MHSRLKVLANILLRIPSPITHNQTPPTTSNKADRRKSIHHTHIHQGWPCSNLPPLFRVLSLPSPLPSPQHSPISPSKQSQTAPAQRPSARCSYHPARSARPSSPVRTLITPLVTFPLPLNLAAPYRGVETYCTAQTGWARSR